MMDNNKSEYTNASNSLNGSKNLPLKPRSISKGQCHDIKKKLLDKNLPRSKQSQNKNFRQKLNDNQSSYLSRTNNTSYNGINNSSNSNTFTGNKSFLLTSYSNYLNNNPKETIKNDTRLNLKDLSTSTMTNKYSIFHSSYQINCNGGEDLRRENLELKHDILVLLGQLQEKEAIINMLKNQINTKGLEINKDKINLIPSSNELENKNKINLLNEQLKNSEIKINKLKDKKNNLKTQFENIQLDYNKLKVKHNILENQLEEITANYNEEKKKKLKRINKFDNCTPCNVYRLNYLVTIERNKNIYHKNRNKNKSLSLNKFNSLSMNNNNINLNPTNQINDNIKDSIPFKISNESNFTKASTSLELSSNPFSNKNEPLGSLVFKPLNCNQILQYDLKNNSFKLINFIDYSNFSKIYQEDGSLYLTIKNCLYIITGSNYNLFYMFNNENKSMTKLSSLINNHKYGGIIKYNNDILCLSGGSTKQAEYYQIKNSKWKDKIIPDLNECRGHSSFLVHNNNIYALFGYDYNTNKYVNSIEVYYGNENKWKILDIKNNEIGGIIGHQGIFRKEKIFIFGGVMLKNEMKIWKYNYLEVDLNLKNVNFALSDKGDIEGKEGNNIRGSNSIDNVNANLLNANSCDGKDDFYFYFCGGFSSFTDCNYSNSNFFREIFVGFDNGNNIHKIYQNNLLHKIENY